MVQDGLGKLEAIHAKRPRAALRSANKHRVRCNKIDDSVRKLMYIYKNGMQRNFELWKENVSKQRLKSSIISAANVTLDSAKVLEMQMKLTRRPIHMAFTKLRNVGNEWSVLSKALRCFEIYINDSKMRTLMRWKFAVLDKNILYKDHRYRFTRGANTLIKLYLSCLRFSLYRLNKGREYKIKTRDCIAKLLFIYKIGVK